MKRIVLLVALAGLIVGVATAAAFPPAGYYRWNANIAWKWADSVACKDDFEGNGCWHVQVYARRGCKDGLYVTLNEYRGTVIVGDVLASAQFVPRGGVVRLELDSDTPSKVSGRVVKIECYNF